MLLLGTPGPLLPTWSRMLSQSACARASRSDRKSRYNSQLPRTAAMSSSTPQRWGSSGSGAPNASHSCNSGSKGCSLCVWDVAKQQTAERTALPDNQTTTTTAGIKQHHQPTLDSCAASSWSSCSCRAASSSCTMMLAGLPDTPSRGLMACHLTQQQRAEKHGWHGMHRSVGKHNSGQAPPPHPSTLQHGRQHAHAP